MNLNDIKLGVSPITERVYLGTVSKRDPGLWLHKRDAVSDVCRVILEWVPPGTIRSIQAGDGSMYEIETRLIPKQVKEPS